MHTLYAHNLLEAKADIRQTGVKCRSRKIGHRTPERGVNCRRVRHFTPRLFPVNLLAIYSVNTWGEVSGGKVSGGKVTGVKFGG